MTVSFDRLQIGKNYTRPELAELWGYKSYEAISRGIVTPIGTPFIIIFITREKQSFLPQYKDAFEGGILQIDGENKHITDERIINSESNGDEIHLFYRDRHHMPFTYHGKAHLSYSQRDTDKPSRFTFAVGEPALISDTSLETEEITHGITDEYVPEEEGKKRIRQHIAYERSRKNRRKAIELHGTSCKACGFNFDDFYEAQVSRSYIEIHHAQSITTQEGKVIDPTIDLIPLCSNCHSMAHRKRGVIMNLEELRAIIRKR